MITLAAITEMDQEIGAVVGAALAAGKDWRDAEMAVEAWACAAGGRKARDARHGLWAVIKDQAGVPALVEAAMDARRAALPAEVDAKWRAEALGTGQTMFGVDEAWDRRTDLLSSRDGYHDNDVSHKEGGQHD
jgi:hypothetical protein